MIPSERGGYRPTRIVGLCHSGSVIDSCWTIHWLNIPLILAPGITYQISSNTFIHIHSYSFIFIQYYDLTVKKHNSAAVFHSQTTMEVGLHVYTIHQNGEFRDDGSVFAVHTTGVKPPPLPWPRHDFVLPHRPHGAQKGGGRGQQKGRDRGGGLLHQEMEKLIEEKWMGA